MAQATVVKRIRITKRCIVRSKGKKRERYEAKLQYLNTLKPGSRFERGPKQLGDGGWVYAM